jgi:Dolichyl-phosphate-mannose-protein mannosyltransferase
MQVEWIEGSRANSDQDFVVLGNRLLEVFDLDNVWRSISAKDSSFHRRSQFSLLDPWTSFRNRIHPRVLITKQNIRVPLKKNPRTARWHAAVPAVLFLLLGALFIHGAGIQTDEALFAGPLCRSWQFFSIHAGHHDVPLMNMPYVGALKTWLYAPLLLRTRHPGAGMIRWPVILIGAATLLLFWSLLVRVHSRRAAWAAAILLATDPSFLLTTAFDWGPVALQHLLLVAALFCAVRWYQTNAPASLAAAGFFCGLALWDKAEFVWIFAGVLAGLSLFAPALFRQLSWRHLALAAGSLCLGAFPLIIYNLGGDPKFATLHSNPQLGSDLTRADFDRKLAVLRSTLDGSSLFGYLVNEDSAPQPKPARTKIQRASFQLRSLTGEHRRNFLFPAFCAALLLFPLLWRTPARKPMCFALLAMAVGWLFMAITGGGGAAHHAVLLWPLPELSLGVAFAEASFHVRFGKVALGVLVALLAATNLLVTNQYLYQSIRNGAPVIWSDGIFAVASRLRETGASQVMLPDWGMADSLCVLTHDSPPARLIDDSFLAQTKPPAEKEDEWKALSDPATIWLEHVSGLESNPGVNERILKAARAAGFEAVMPETYFDSNGRAIFQTFRFATK